MCLHVPPAVPVLRILRWHIQCFLATFLTIGSKSGHSVLRFGISIFEILTIVYSVRFSSTLRHRLVWYAIQPELPFKGQKASQVKAETRSDKSTQERDEDGSSQQESEIEYGDDKVQDGSVDHSKDNKDADRDGSCIAESSGSSSDSNRPSIDIAVKTIKFDDYNLKMLMNLQKDLDGDIVVRLL
ncbi:hypothetical protein HAX54_006277, partial [Datura stramonium]|nr:hypothetical protein [Datura stramonium]